jgi:hypothetical protein
MATPVSPACSSWQGPGGRERNDGQEGSEAVATVWSDNQLTLWPGEQQTITACYDAAALRGSEPALRLSGWNLESQWVGAG